MVDLGRKVNLIYDAMFSKGIHVMKEDVWDCTSYEFPGVDGSNCRIAQSRNPGLLRIPNNSFLCEDVVEKIAHNLSSELSTG